MIFDKTNFNYNSSILLYHCTLVRISNVNISVNAYSGGILAMSVKERFVIESIKVQLECLGDHKFDHPTHGIMLCYNNRGGNDDANVTLCNFNYKINGSCIHSSRYAIMVLSMQYKTSVNITVEDTKFQNLNYSGALFYCMLSYKNLKAANFIYIKNSMISSNTGGSTDTCTMFYFKLFKPFCAKSINIKCKERITTKQ